MSSDTSTGSTTSSSSTETNVVPLLILIYGMICMAVIYGIVSFLQQQRRQRQQQQHPNGGVVIRDTVNNKTVTSSLDRCLMKYEKQMLELNAQTTNPYAATTTTIHNDLTMDITYMANQLRPYSTLWDIITICCSTPTSLQWSIIDYNRVTMTRQQRIIEQQQQQHDGTTTTNKTTSSTPAVDVFDELFNDDTGWDNDDDDETTSTSTTTTASSTTTTTSKHTSAAAAANKRRLGGATDTTILLEGIDDGVLGQQWVERVLQTIPSTDSTAGATTGSASTNTSTTTTSNDSSSTAVVWPPSDLGIFTNRTYEYTDPLLELDEVEQSTNSKNKMTTTSPTTAVSDTQHKKTKTLVGVLDHPALRRTLCMVVARYNSIRLNNHSELIDAGMKQLIDQTYFKSSMEFRSRINMLLETSIQIAMMLQCYPLLCTILTTSTTFKIGITNDAKAIPYFNTVMTRQYNILPRLKINSQIIRRAPKQPPTSTTTTNGTDKIDDNDDDDDTTTPTTMYTGDAAEVILDVERIHATQFLRVKTEQCQQQGIPAQIGLQSYRERWWFMLRIQRIASSKDQNVSQSQQLSSKTSSTSGTSITTNSNVTDIRQLFPPITIPPEAKFTMDPKNIQRFETAATTSTTAGGVCRTEDRLLTAWPLTITNIAQQRGQVKIQFMAPPIAGRYRYYLHVHSSDFLGANQDVEFTMTILDRKPMTVVESTTITTTVVTDNEPKKEK